MNSVLRSVSLLALVAIPSVSQGCGGTTAAGNPVASSYAVCDGPGQCLAKVPGCCGVCGAPTLEDVVGVNSTALDDFRSATCSDPHPNCPKCAEMIEPNLVAFCEDKRCTALDVRTDAVSACQTDDDCMLRAASCCDLCAPMPNELIAIAKKEAARYRTEICVPSEPCVACAPMYPAGWVAACGTDKRCRVVEKTNVCPSSQPLDGAPCGLNATLVCEYGDDARSGCRTHVTCPNGAFQVAVSGCPPLPTAGQQGCPAVAPDGGSTCSNDGLVCDMGADSFCACSTCTGGPCSVTPRWACGGPPTTPGCSSRLPALGSACAEEGLVCTYGPTCVAPVAAGRRCTDGAWVDEPLLCPA